jgi:hypothetical protein
MWFHCMKRDNFNLRFSLVVCERLTYAPNTRGEDVLRTFENSLLRTVFVLKTEKFRRNEENYKNNFIIFVFINTFKLGILRNYLKISK